MNGEEIKENCQSGEKAGFKRYVCSSELKVIQLSINCDLPVKLIFSKM